MAHQSAQRVTFTTPPPELTGRGIIVEPRISPRVKRRKTPAGQLDLNFSRAWKLTVRKFYVCPLGKDDPDKCKFFKWADELFADGTEKSPGGAAEIIAAARERYGGPPKSVQPQSFGGAGQSLGGPPRTLGQEPQSRTRRPAAATAFTPTTSRVAPITPQTTSRIISKAPEEEADDIDWDKVDTDSLERDAIASTPGSSQQDTTNSETLQERLLAVSPLAATKRKREDDDDNTPKVDRTPKRPVTGDDDVSLTDVPVLALGGW